jgi:hypothetical protein
MPFDPKGRGPCQVLITVLVIFIAFAVVAVIAAPEPSQAALEVLRLLVQLVWGAG